MATLQPLAGRYPCRRNPIPNLPTRAVTSPGARGPGGASSRSCRSCSRSLPAAPCFGWSRAARLGRRCPTGWVQPPIRRRPHPRPAPAPEGTARPVHHGVQRRHPDPRGALAACRAAPPTVTERYDFRPLFGPGPAVLSGRGPRHLPPGDAALARRRAHRELPRVRDAARAGARDRVGRVRRMLDGLEPLARRRGERCARRPCRWLDRAGLEHAGTARTRRESRRDHDVRRRGRAGRQPLVHVRASTASSPMSAGARTASSCRLILRSPRRERRRPVPISWSCPCTSEPSTRTSPTRTSWRSPSSSAGRPTIDLVVGHHAHVVQPLHRQHGTWVAYGFGNLVSGMTSSLGTEAVADGVVFLADATRRGERLAGP